MVLANKPLLKTLLTSIFNNRNVYNIITVTEYSSDVEPSYSPYLILISRPWKATPSLNSRCLLKTSGRMWKLNLFFVRTPLTTACKSYYLSGHSILDFEVTCEAIYYIMHHTDKVYMIVLCSAIFISNTIAQCQLDSIELFKIFLSQPLWIKIVYVLSYTYIYSLIIDHKRG